MPLYTKKEFADLTGIAQKHISTMKERGKIAYEADGKMIDSNHQTNQLFIKEREVAMAKQGKKPQLTISAAPQRADSGDGGSAVGATTLVEIEAQKRVKELQKITEEVKFLTLKNQKAVGEIVPAAPIEHLVLRFKQYVLTNQSIAFEQFLIEIGHKYEITSEDLAYYRGNYKKLLNTAIATASTEFTDNLENILTEYIQKRGVGQHD